MCPAFSMHLHIPQVAVQEVEKPEEPVATFY